jgi:hypothetical protein
MINDNKNPADKPVDKARRRAYIKSKGINPGEEMQLSLIFPEAIGNRTDLRHIPNDYARSSLFTVRNKNEPRRMCDNEKLFHCSENVTAFYTGVELRAEDDEIIWLQIASYGQHVPMGKPFEFNIKSLVQDVGWAKNGANYDRARECIRRLRSNAIMFQNNRAYGTTGFASLIRDVYAVNDVHGKPTKYRAMIDPNLIALFAGNTFTSHRWLVYRKLSPVARRLADYVESHKQPYPLPLEKFKQMCGSDDKSPTGWRRNVKQACSEVEEAGIAASVKLIDDQICCTCE